MLVDVGVSVAVRVGVAVAVRVGVAVGDGVEVDVGVAVMVLVGDACHINNPLGGMGMNGGLHDAFNLAEKLVAVVDQAADYTEAFRHYDRQRRELAVKFVQEHTINNKKLMESTDTDVQNQRQKMLMETAADPVRAKAFLMERAMINCVRDSLAVE